MPDIRTININLTWAETKVQQDGSLLFTVGGVTAGGNSHKVVFKMDPSTIGYIAEDFHRAVSNMQDRLNNIKARLRGQ